MQKNFRLELSLNALFYAFVRPILEYEAVVLDPHTAVNYRQLERVQRRFLRFASFLQKIPYTTHNYTPFASYLGLTSLVQRRRTSRLKFLAGLLNNKIDSSTRITLICFKVPPRLSRFTAPFYVSHATTNYMANEPLRHLMSITNIDPDFNDLLFI